MKKLFFLFLVLLTTTPTLAGGNYFIRQKIVEFPFPYGINVLGVPVTNLGLDYYYELSTPNKELAEDIATRVVDKLLTIETDEEGEEAIPEEPIDEASILHEEVEKLFLTKCNTCHKTDTNGLQILTNGKLNTDLTVEDWWNIFDRIDGSGLEREQIMPKNGEILSDEEVQLVREFIRTLANGS